MVESPQAEKPTLFSKLKQTPKKVKKVIAITCAAAVIATTIPFINLTANAQTEIHALTMAYLNIRKGAGMNYDVLKVLDKNQSLTVIDKSNPEWLKVKLSDGTTGFCSASYLDITTDAKTNTYVNLRKGAGIKYDVIKTLAPDQKLDIIKFCGNSWAQVKTSDGTKGYISTDYISYLSNETAKPVVLTSTAKTYNAAQTSRNAKTQTSALGADNNNANSGNANKASDSGVTISQSSATLPIGKTLALSAKSASGGSIVWSCSNKSVATITSKGVVTAVMQGSATVTAKDQKTGKTARCNIKVEKTAITSIKLNAEKATIITGDSFVIRAATAPVNGEVSYSSSAAKVATVSEKGVVKAIAPGTAKITVSDISGSVKSVCTITVKNLPTISLSASSASVKVGANTIIRANISDNSVVTWSSSNNNIASVRNGAISGLKAGSATITASDSTGRVKASCKVTVNAVSSYGVSLSRYSASTTAGKTIYIKGYANHSAGWGSSDNIIATVWDGFIETKNPGKCAITYTDVYGKRAVCIVTVYDADPIKFTYSSPNSAVRNSTVKLIAITDKSRTDVKFVINENGSSSTVKASQKRTEGNTLVWTGYYKVTNAGVHTYKAYSFKNNKWSTSKDGTADIYVSSKTDIKTTALDRLRASDEVIKFIGNKEGFVADITYDRLANNIPTLAHGYVVWEGDCFYDHLTRSEGYALLVEAINKEVYASRVNDVLIENNIRFNQQQFDALVSFSYNLGTGWTNGGDILNILKNSYGEVSTGSTVYGTVNADDGLNLRKSYTTSSEVITVLEPNQKVILLSTQKYNGVWYKVKTSTGVTGYCSGTYLNLSTGTTTGRDLNYVNKNALINEILAYHHAGGVCYYGLLYRRCDELEMFLYGDYADDGHMNYHYFPSPSCLHFQYN